MKVAYFAESPADQAALTILTEAILGQKTESVLQADLRQRGWPTVRTVLPAVLRQLHYHADAEGLVLIVDSNGAPPHLPAHEPPGTLERKCRLCQLRKLTEEVLGKVRPRSNQPALKVAIGLAVPAIEAWLLCGVDAHVTEAAWINGLKEKPGAMPYSKGSLKRQLYDTSHPSLALETERMKEAATRLANDLSSIEKLFPHGFGALLKNLKSWIAPSA
jgi:hypothetical protein